MELILVTKNDCRFCGVVENYLKEEDVPYKEINVTLEPEYIEKLDVMSAPTTILMDEEEEVGRVTGDDLIAVDELVDALYE